MITQKQIASIDALAAETGLAVTHRDGYVALLSGDYAVCHALYAGRAWYAAEYRDGRYRFSDVSGVKHDTNSEVELISNGRAYASPLAALVPQIRAMNRCD